MHRLHSLPHHDGSELYAPDRSPQIGDRFRVRVRVPHEFGELAGIAVRVLVDAEPRFAPLARACWRPDRDRGAEWWQGEFDVRNPVSSYRFLVNRADGGSVWLNADGVDRVEPLDALDFRVTTFAAPPAWAASQVMYQIFPDRFARSAAASARPTPDWAVPTEWTDDVVHVGPDASRQLFGGDLDGITEHLDHLERLGVTLVYLTPFFPACSNHRYDASSFDVVDPVLGGDDALVRLVEAAHARGIRVIGDLTTNHTGAAHEWFTAAHRNPGVPEGEFYYWKDPAQTEYVAWYDVPSLPKLNWNSRELRRRFVEGADSVVAKWLLPPYNLDGWRIDVANMTGRLGSDDLNRDVQRTVRATMDQVAPGTVLYAESTNDAARDFEGDGWQGPMSYSAFTRPVWQWLRRPAQGVRHHFGIPYETEPRYSAVDVVSSYRRFTAGYPWAVRELAMNAIDTHDIPRFAERADDAEQLVAAGLSMTLPGTPVIFAGDEFGLHGESGEHSRTPLPWNQAPRLAEAYGRLGNLRTRSQALQSGGLRWLHVDPEAMMFVRELEDECVLVVAARGASDVTIPASAVGGFDPEAAVVFGDARIDLEGVSIRISTTGPTFAAWKVGTSAHPVVGAGWIAASRPEPVGA